MINRVAVKHIIENTPTQLRNLARKERKVLIEATKNDPVGTAFQAANGQFNYANNGMLTKKLNELNVQMAKDAYSKGFIHRQPMGEMVPQKTHDVIKASHIMD